MAGDGSVVLPGHLVLVLDLLGVQGEQIDGALDPGVARAQGQGDPQEEERPGEVETAGRRGEAEDGHDHLVGVAEGEPSQGRTVSMGRPARNVRTLQGGSGHPGEIFYRGPLLAGDSPARTRELSTLLILPGPTAEPRTDSGGP